MFAIAVSPYHKTITGQDGVSWEWLHQCGGLWFPPLLLKTIFIFKDYELAEKKNKSLTSLKNIFSVASRRSSYLKITNLLRRRINL